MVVGENIMYNVGDVVVIKAVDMLGFTGRNYHPELRHNGKTVKILDVYPTYEDEPVCYLVQTIEKEVLEIMECELDGD